MMSSADQYRIKAAMLAAEARDETHAAIRTDLFRMSQGYLRLAEQAVKNTRLDICYETPPTSKPANPA
jgi:hypothetical protein